MMGTSPDEPTWAEVKKAEHEAATQAQKELPKGVDRMGENYDYWGGDAVTPPVDPESVRVGDVVEIKTPFWRIEAECISHPSHGYLGVRTDHDRSINLTGATVRILQPADSEPEPDGAAVEALIRVYEAAETAVSDPEDGSYYGRDLVRELARRGVQVVSTDE